MRFGNERMDKIKDKLCIMAKNKNIIEMRLTQNNC